MDSGEPEILERLVTALENADVEFARTHHKPVYTSAEAAEVRGTTLHSGAKALVVKGGDAPCDHDVYS